MDRKIIATFVSDLRLGAVIQELEQMPIEETDISFFMSPKFKRIALPTNLGPLKGGTMETIQKKLIHLGLATDMAKEIKAYLNEGGAVAVIACEEQYLNDVTQLMHDGGAVYVDMLEQ